MSYVYVAAVIDRGKPLTPVKIGVSRNPWSRVHEMQTGSPLPIGVVHAIWFRSRDEAFQIERHLHDVFAKERLHGEWFNAHPVDVLDQLAYLVDIGYWRDYHDIPLFLHAVRLDTGLYEAFQIIERGLDS